MNFKLPLYKQQKDNTCALACLRMVLAAYGTHVQEAELEAAAHLEKRGTLIDELERLARQFHLVAEVQPTTLDDLQRLLASDHFPIAYIDRAVFDLTPRQRRAHRLHDARIHTIIPIRVSSGSITYHDPLGPRVRRKSVRLFELAHGLLGGACVVCSKPRS